MTTRFTEVIREWLGWCPNTRIPAVNRMPAATGNSLAKPAASPDPAATLENRQGEYRYYHTQPNFAGGNKITYLLVALTLIGFAAIVFAPLPLYMRPLILVLAILALVNAAFSSLTVAISQEKLEFWFGVGIWHKRHHLYDIAACAVVKNSWWNGWGIRWTPHGWLYNVAGSDAVEILFTNGKKIRIGTDEPQRLADAINHAIR